MTEQEFVIVWGFDRKARLDKSKFRLALKSLLNQARIDELNLLLESGSISPTNSVNEVFVNRIKELKELKCYN